MATYSKLSALVSGVQRQLDLAANTLVVDTLKVGGGSGTDLTKTILDGLIALQTNLAKTDSGDAGSTYVGDDDSYTNFTPSEATVKGALEGIDSALASVTIDPEFSDSAFRIQDNGDATKEIAFEASAITTGTVRTVTMPDANVDLGHIANLQTLSGVAAGATSLGAFTGTTIADNQTVKAAIQSLETALEALPDPMEYKGNWAASTNTPTLEDGTGNNGDVYYVTDAGTVDFGAGNIIFAAGDRVVYSGTDGEWQKWDTTDSVTSVNGETGAVTLDTDDIDEGATNKYYVVATAQTDLIASSISNGDTTHAPSGDAVFDALALKQGASANLDEASTFFGATNLTGAEAETLSDGSNADTLHSHALIKEAGVAGEAMAANTLFAVRYAKAADAGFAAGRLYKADKDASSADNFYVVGLVRPGSLLAAGDPVTVTKMGPMAATSHGYTVGAPIFINSSGALTGTAPSSANEAVVRVGIAKDANTIEVQVSVVGVN